MLDTVILGIVGVLALGLTTLAMVCVGLVVASFCILTQSKISNLIPRRKPAIATIGEREEARQVDLELNAYR